MAVNVGTASISLGRLAKSRVLDAGAHEVACARPGACRDVSVGVVGPCRNTRDDVVLSTTGSVLILLSQMMSLQTLRVGSWSLQK